MAELYLFIILLCTVVYYNIVTVELQATHYRCPSVCSCLGTMVDCSKRGIDSMPSDIPHWVTIL